MRKKRGRHDETPRRKDEEFRLKEALDQRRRESALAIGRSVLAQGVEPDTIRDITGLSLSEIEATYPHAHSRSCIDLRDVPTDVGAAYMRPSKVGTKYSAPTKTGNPMLFSERAYG